MTTFNERFNEAFQKSGMTQVELSSKTGISTSAISCYVKGQREAKQHAIYKLAKVFRVNEAWLMGYDIAPERSTEVQIRDRLEELTEPQLKMVLGFIDVITKEEE